MKGQSRNIKNKNAVFIICKIVESGIVISFCILERSLNHKTSYKNCIVIIYHN